MGLKRFVFLRGMVLLAREVGPFRYCSTVLALISVADGGIKPQYAGRHPLQGVEVRGSICGGHEEQGTGKHFNALCLVGPEGDLLLHYRKRTPWPYAEKGWASPGDRGLQTIDTPYGRLAILICYDINFEPPNLKERGVEIHRVLANHANVVEMDRTVASEVASLSFVRSSGIAVADSSRAEICQVSLLSEDTPVAVPGSRAATGENDGRAFAPGTPASQAMESVASGRAGA